MSDVVAKRLKEARLAKGLSQKKLGIAAGIDEFTASPRMNQYERGVHVPDYNTLARLAEVLEVPVPYFYATDDVLATWIKCFPRLSKSEREKIITESSND